MHRNPDPDGSVTGTNDFVQNGEVYTLTGNIAIGVQVKKSNIVIDGSGYTLSGNGGLGIDLSNDIQQDFSRPRISNVTLRNLRIVNCSVGVYSNGGSNNNFYAIYVANCSQECFFLIGSARITCCTIKGTTAISMDYGSSYNVITENNLTGSIIIWLSEGETVDGNFWSDYLIRYPYATEIGNSGIGNTPYIFCTAQNGSTQIMYQDSHPRMTPIILPTAPPTSPPSSTPSFTLTPTLTPSENPTSSPSASNSPILEPTSSTESTPFIDHVSLPDVALLLLGAISIFAIAGIAVFMFVKRKSR